jgi:hypothetical protein
MSGDTLTAKIKAISAQLESVLITETLTEVYTPKAKIYVKVYEEIAKRYNIHLEIKGDADKTSIEEKTIPAKRAQETGLDYLGRIYKTFGLQINGKPTHARFSPFPTTLSSKDSTVKDFAASNIKALGFGVFEIYPLEDWVPTVTYEYRGIKSKVLRYAPVLNPWLARKAQASATVVSIEDKTGKATTHSSKIDTSTKGVSDYVRELSRSASSQTLSNPGARLVTNAPAEVSKIRLQQEQSNLLSRAVKADITILGDPYLAFRDYVRINVFHPLSGELKSSSIFAVQGATHTIEGGFFTSEVRLISTPDYYALLNKEAKSPSFSMINSDLPFIADTIADLQNSLGGFFA